MEFGRKKILITGINGFLGSHLATILKKYQIFGLGRESGFKGNIPIYSSRDIDNLGLEFDFVVMTHAAISSGNATVSNEDLYNVNVSLTEKIVHRYKNAFLIYVSTVSIYDAWVNPITELSQINPQSDYALSKLWGEMVVSSSVKYSILRISSMFGEGMKENTIIPNYVNQALENREIKVWGDGKRRQNYIHVSDVVKYIELILHNKDKLEKRLMLGVSKREYSNFEIAAIISKITNSSINFIGDDHSKSLQYNNEYTCDLINWSPSMILDEELEKYIKWKQKKY